MRIPPIAAGGVLVEADRIVAVGTAAALEARAGRVVTHRGVLLPGLVDASTRVEWADARRGAGSPGEWDDERRSRSARRGAHEVVRAGVALACDVVAHGPGVPALSRAGVAGDSLVEVADVTDREADDVLASLEHSLGLRAAGRRVGAAVAAGRVGPAVLVGVAALTERLGAPLRVEADGLGLEALDTAGVLRPGARVAVAAGADHDLLERLAEHGAVLEVAPRMAPARITADAAVVLGSGGGVAPDPLADAAAWAARSGVGAEQAVALVTDEGARVLGLGEDAGVLAPGRRADLVVVDVAAGPDDVYDALLADGPGRQTLTLLAGVRRARRASGDEPWPEHRDHKYEES